MCPTPCPLSHNLPSPQISAKPTKAEKWEAEKGPEAELELQKTLERDGLSIGKVVTHLTKCVSGTPSRQLCTHALTLKYQLSQQAAVGLLKVRGGHHKAAPQAAKEFRALAERHSSTLTDILNDTSKPYTSQRAWGLLHLTPFVG